MTAWLALALSASAATLTVGPAWPFATIGDAVLAANDGDVIAIEPGTYDEAVLIEGLDLTLSALGVVTWQGQGADLLTLTDSSVTVLGVDFRPDGGRAITSTGSDTAVLSSTFADNAAPSTAAYGAAIQASGGGSLTVTACTFTHNVAGGSGTTAGGHVSASGADLTLLDSTFTGGRADVGGAVYLGQPGTLLVDGCTFTNNRAQVRGGAIGVDDAALTVTSSTFTDNRAVHGGAIGSWDHSALLAADLDACTFIGNQATGTGGAVFIGAAGSLTVLNAVLLGNQAGSDGGGLEVRDVGALTLRRSYGCGSAAGRSGGLAHVLRSGPGTWTNNAFVRSTAQSDGGGLYVEQSGDQLLVNNHLLDGDAAGRGGAVYTNATDLTLTNNLIAWTADGDGVDATASALTLISNAFFDNLPAHVSPPLTTGSSPLLGDPLLQAYNRDLDCTDDILRLASTSPLIDAGSPTLRDPDGSPSDIGAFGGPDSDPALYDDHDADGVIAAYDCDDDAATVFPGRVESCDGLDNDCDGRVDLPPPPASPTWYPDRDDDGFGDDARGLVACEAGPPYVDLGGDCDDANPDVRPGAPEVCDGADNDCNGSTDGPDAADQLTWYADADGDGHGTTASSVGGCAQPAGYALSAGDCDDADPTISPSADERCDAVDNNCDGLIDGPDAIDPRPWYADADGDGWGAPGPGTRFSCTDIPGTSRYATDCDDADPTRHPYAPEDCQTGVDHNCDGSTGQADADADGWPACEDCDDGEASIHPGASDAWYDGLIQDCSHASDFDADQDGFDAAAWGGDDCDDADSTVHPGAVDGGDDDVDQDCDGIPTEAGPAADKPPPGCTCDATSAAAPRPALSAALLLLLLRRRRAR